MRSAVTGPNLPLLHTRITDFDQTIASTLGYLRSMWHELEGVRVDVAQAPAAAIHGDHIDRWKVDHDARRITFFRLPIVRFIGGSEPQPREAQMFIESCVFRAVGELLGRDPWDLAPGRYRGF